MNLEAEVLRQDRRGRVRVPVERREALLDEFEKTETSAADFARLTGIKDATFANWVLRRRKERAGPAGERTDQPKALGFVEAVVEQPALQRAEGLLAELPGGSRVRVQSAAQLALAAELVSLVARSQGGRC